MQIGAFAVIVIFQPELRNLLERMGRFKVGRIIDFASDTTEDDLHRVIDSIAQAAANMSATKTGALIVMERATRLGEYISTGTMLDANVSSGLLENIFVPNTPLHDGAVIIRNNKIVTAKRFGYTSQSGDRTQRSHRRGYYSGERRNRQDFHSVKRLAYA